MPTEQNDGWAARSSVAGPPGCDTGKGGALVLRLSDDLVEDDDNDLFLARIPPPVGAEALSRGVMRSKRDVKTQWTTE